MSRLSLLGDEAVVLTAASRLTENDNGKVFFLNSGTEFQTTLPPLRMGLRFTFIVQAAPSGANYTIFTHGGANVIIGGQASADLNAASDADFETSGCDTISFVSAKAVKGDMVELFCDGTNWYAYVISSLFDAVTYTTAA